MRLDWCHVAIKSEPELSPKAIAEAQKANKKFLDWLNSQVQSPPNKKEKERMTSAIAFDMDHMRVYLGQTVEERMEIMGRLGYIYD